MITDDQLNVYRVDGTTLRVVRDANPKNDVRGIVVAWDEESVLIRKRNRRLVKLDRRYVYQPYDAERSVPSMVTGAIGEHELGDGDEDGVGDPK
jgi:hypothetical protein